MIALADSQLLRTIRDIRGLDIDGETIEDLIAAKESLSRKRLGSASQQDLMALTRMIYELLYIRDYVTVVIEHPAHYRRIFEDGITINGSLYRR